MVEERVVEVERPAGATHTTVYTDAPRSGGGAGWVVAVILVIAVLAGIYLFSNMSNSSARKDNAVAAAANDVGKAATKVGNAAQDAADKATQ
ncbi:MAG: hypothetical protein RIS94_2995 [Pseudomonadota bacterium]|jgi:hypothetical protein